MQEHGSEYGDQDTDHNHGDHALAGTVVERDGYAGNQPTDPQDERNPARRQKQLRRHEQQPDDNQGIREEKVVHNW